MKRAIQVGGFVCSLSLIFLTACNQKPNDNSGVQEATKPTSADAKTTPGGANNIVEGTAKFGFQEVTSFTVEGMPSLTAKLDIMVARKATDGKVTCEVVKKHRALPTNDKWREFPIALYNVSSGEARTLTDGFRNAFKFFNEDLNALTAKVGFTFARKSFDSLWRLRARPVDEKCQGYAELCTHFTVEGDKEICHRDEWRPIHDIRAHMNAFTLSDIKLQFYDLNDSEERRAKNPWESGRLR